MSIENTPYFHKEGALERVDGDLELFSELISLLFATYDDTIRRLESAIEKKDSEQLEQLSHAIKSAFGNLGAMRAFHTSHNLERKGKTNDFSGTEELLVQLQEEVAKFKEEAESILP